MKMNIAYSINNEKSIYVSNTQNESLYKKMIVKRQD